MILSYCSVFILSSLVKHSPLSNLSKPISTERSSSYYIRIRPSPPFSKSCYEPMHPLYQLHMHKLSDETPLNMILHQRLQDIHEMTLSCFWEVQGFLLSSHLSVRSFRIDDHARYHYLKVLVSSYYLVIYDSYFHKILRVLPHKFQLYPYPRQPLPRLLPYSLNKSKHYCLQLSQLLSRSSLQSIQFWQRVTQLIIKLKSNNNKNKTFISTSFANYSIRAGFPTAVHLDGISRITTVPAPIMLCSPICFP